MSGLVMVGLSLSREVCAMLPTACDVMMIRWTLEEEEENGKEEGSARGLGVREASRGARGLSYQGCERPVAAVGTNK